MIVREMIEQSPFRFYESDLISDVSQVLVENEINGGIVFSCKQNIVGVFVDKEVFIGLQKGKKHLRELPLSDFKLLNETDEILAIEYGPYSCNPVQNSKGEITGYLTKERYLQAYAKASHLKVKHFDAVFNSAHNGILSIDSSGRITSINPQAIKMANTTKESAIGKVLTDVVLPTGLLDVVRTGKGHTEKYQAGKRKYITNRSPIIEDNEIVGAVGVFQDISEIEFISNELETVKQIVSELDTIIDTSTNGICIVDETCNIQRMNSQFNKMFQIQTESDNHSELPSYIIHLVNQVFAEKRERSILQKDSKTDNSLIVSATPVFDNDRNQVVRIVINVKDMTEMEKLRNELAKTKEMLNALNYQNESGFIYKSSAMNRLVTIAQQVAEVDVTVLLTGESGVGKSEIANLIQELSPRRNQSYVRVNCGAIPASLIESELFGYVPGAFTGALETGKVGYFEQADGGTIFLDEIGELPQSLQVKLLNVLQEKVIFKIGSVKPKKIDVRIIAATNRNLKEAVAKGEFREDLYYRLNVVPLEVPALRDREEDIPLLINHFMKKFSKKYRRKLQFTNESMKGFLNYSWPGNVRELINVLERTFITSMKSEVHYEDVLSLLNVKQEESHSEVVSVNKLIPLREAILQLEKQLLVKALDQGKTYRKAAKLLDVNVSTVSRKIKKLESEAEWLL